MIKELDVYELWQMETKGNILPPTNIIPESEEFENGYDPFKNSGDLVTVIQGIDVS